MRKDILLISLALLGVSGLHPIRGQVLELGGRYWQMKPSGQVAAGADGISGTTVDLKEDLGYRSEETVTGFDAKLGGKVDIALSYFSLDLSARGFPDQSIRFDDVLYTAPTQVDSTLEASFLRAGLRFQAGSHGFRGGLLAGVQRIEVDASLAAPEYGEARASADTVFPVAGAQLRIDPFSWLRLDFSLVGGRWDWDGWSATFWDGEANARVNLSVFFLGLGYRYVNVDATDDSVPLSADIKFSGPQLIGGLSF